MSKFALLILHISGTIPIWLWLLVYSIYSLDKPLMLIGLVFSSLCFYFFQVTMHFGKQLERTIFVVNKAEKYETFNTMYNLLGYKLYRVVKCNGNEVDYFLITKREPLAITSARRLSMKLFIDGKL